MADMAAISRVLARNAEMQFRDECRIRRKTGVVFNEATGQNEDTFTTVYEGPCWVNPTAMAERVVEHGGAPLVLKAYQVKVPRSVASVRSGDEIRFVSTTDPALTNVDMNISDVMFSTDPTSRKIVAELTS